MRLQQYERKRQRIKGQPEESAVPFLMIQEENRNEFLSIYG